MKKHVKRTLAVIMVIIMTVMAVPIGNFAGLDFATKASAADYKVGDIIEFGSYPQSKVTGDGSYGSMHQSDFMMYADVEYMGNMYRAVRFTNIRPQSTYDPYPKYNNVINTEHDWFSVNNTYWFKWDPLKWSVIDPSNGYVLSNIVIDSQPYSNTIYKIGEQYYNDPDGNNYANDYATSSIRRWLNDDFYYTAFNSSQQNKIKATALDNTAFPGYGSYDGIPTNDKIFIISYNEARTYKMGSYYDCSEYARCQGAMYGASYSGYTYWKKAHYILTRSPYSNSDYVTCLFPDSNYTSHLSSNNNFTGILPAFCFKSGDIIDESINVSGVYTYRDTGNNTCTIVKASPLLNGAVSIPNELNGLKVTSISENAFENCTRVTQLTIPSSMIYIDKNAFSDLLGLSDIYFKSGNCKILGGANTIPPRATIHSCNCAGTDVKDYAEKHGKEYLESIAQQRIIGTRDTCYRTICQNCYASKNYNNHTVNDMGKMQFCSVCNFMLKTGVEAGIDKLLAVYPTGSYFTKSGKEYKANSGSENLLQNINNPPTNGLPSGAEAYPNACWSCCAFARYAYYVIFGESAAKAQAKTYSTASFSGAQVGDIVFMHKRGTGAGTGHWGVYLGYDNGKISLYDSNWEHDNQVIYGNKINLSKYSDTITVYHSNSYNQINMSSPAQTKKFVTIDAVFHCPIEITVSYSGETLSSAENKLKTSFGTMKKNDDGSIALSLDYNDNYDFKVTGTGYGTMDVEATITTTDSDDINYKIYNVPITDVTSINVDTDKTSGALVFVADVDGDENDDTTYTVEKNETVYCDSSCKTDEDHELVQLIESHEASCVENGYTDSYFCIKCGKLITKPEVIPATGHSFGEWKITKAANCTEKGTEMRKCKLCGETEERIINAAGHKPIIDSAVEVTCTKDGKTEGSHCSACGEVLIEQKNVPATGHIDADNDNVCDTCGKQISNTNDPSKDDCDCMCHKSGFVGFFWKFIRVFYQIFKTNKTCKCGVNHY